MRFAPRSKFSLIDKKQEETKRVRVPAWRVVSGARAQAHHGPKTVSGARLGATDYEATIPM